MRELSLPTKARLTSDLIPDLALTHGHAVLVLEALGFSAGAPDATFQHYIKSLRKLGVPFKRGEPGLTEGKLARYSFNHMMELSVALKLRVYGALPDPIVEGLIGFRERLHPLYRRAYLEHATGLGTPTEVTASGRAGFAMRGVYLDLRVRYAGGRCLGFGPPRALSPFEALRVFAHSDECGRAHLPFNLSTLSIHLVECAQRGPPLRGWHQASGRPPPPRAPRFHE